MAFNETITYGNITIPIVSEMLKVDQASNGGLTLAIHAFMFLAIMIAFYKKDKELERGIAAAGFTTAITSSFLTIVGYLSWNYIWMSVALFIIALVAKLLENKG